MCETDEQCIQDCRDGHPEAFGHLVRRYQGPLLGYLIGRLGNADKAAEAAQESLVRAYFALEKLLKPQSFLPWLLGIADRVVKEARRAEQRRSKAVLEHREMTETVEKASGWCQAAVARAVAELPETYREVVLLRYYRGLSCAEISRDRGVPLGTVTKRLSRAYALLREFLQEKSGKEDVEVS